MSDFSIWVVQYGVAGGHPTADLLHGKHGEPARVLPYCFGLLRSADRTVLVDTGFGDEANQRRLSAKYRDTVWVTPVAALARLGVPADAIDTILLTHRHFDHAGAVDCFPDAHVYIQRREVAAYEAALRLPARFSFLLKATDPNLLDTLEARGRRHLLTLVDGDLDPLPGVALRPAFDTHTPGSQYMCVDNGADGRWVFPGDNVYVHENVEGVGGDGVLVPIGSSMGSQERWLHVVDGLLDSVDRDTRRVLPFHDNELWQRFPSRVFDDGLHVAEISLAGGHPSELSR
jgi:glyoxylase-like metal-dependent hydrolase (beta-lactamase superfamily II)